MDKPVTREIRSFSDYEIRDDSTAGGPVFEGYASTFNSPYDMGVFTEQVDPQAFARSLANSPNVPLLIDHKGTPLARTESGTLQLSTDSRGLHARSVLDPANPKVQELMSAMRRGDLNKMSFAFRVNPNGDVWENDFTLRTLTSLELNGGDVSVVTYPANSDTSASLRSASVSDAEYVFMERVMREHYRSGAAISAANMTKLRAILANVKTADDAIDQAEADLAAVIGVPNPDDDAAAEPSEGMEQNSSRRLAYAQRVALALELARPRQ